MTSEERWDEMEQGEKRPHGVEGNERINTLSDGVFAIVITLLVLEISVPRVPPGELDHALREMVPEILSHIFSFVVLGIYWVGHHNLFLHIKRHDRVLIWLNILFLMFVASMPFPTGLIIQYSNQQTAVVVYAGVLVLAGISLDLIWWYASRNHRLVEPDLDSDLIAFVHRRILMAPMIYLLSIGVSFISPAAARLVAMIVALIYIVPNPLDHYHHRELGRARSTDSVES